MTKLLSNFEYGNETLAIQEYFEKVVNVLENGVVLDGSDQKTNIQNVINNNPNSVIYFPKGTYNISNTLYVSCVSTNRVVLMLNKYATLKANANFPTNNYLVNIGGTGTFDVNDGTPLGIIGGILDTNYRAGGVKVEHCSVAQIRNMTIKNLSHVGIDIEKRSPTANSSDAQVSDVIIYGQDGVDNYGMILNGFDNNINTFRTMNTWCGIQINSGGNVIVDAHPLCGVDTLANYSASVGFDLIGSDNKLVNCYSDQYATGFKFYNSGKRNIIQNGFCFWYQSTAGKRHFAFDGNMNGNTIDGFTVSVPANGTNGIYAPLNVAYNDIYPITGEQYINARIKNINIANPENMYYKLNDYGLIGEDYFQVRRGSSMAADNWLPVGIFLMDNTTYIQCEANVTFGWDTIIDVVFNKAGVTAVKTKYKSVNTRTVRAVLTDVDTPFGSLPCRILWISPNFTTNIMRRTTLTNGNCKLLSPVSWIDQLDALFNLSTTAPSNQIGNIVTSD